jgi:hypothetical protein
VVQLASVQQCHPSFKSNTPPALGGDQREADYEKEREGRRCSGEHRNAYKVCVTTLKINRAARTLKNTDTEKRRYE